MKIVIEIPDEEYKRMIEKRMFGRVDVWKNAICNGTPLPKGHGRLIDADAVLEDPYGFTYKDIDIAETIIEADREGEKDGRGV